MLKLIPLICGLVGLLVTFVVYSWIARVNGKNKADYQTISLNDDLFRRDDWMTIIITIIVLSVATGVFAGWFGCVLYLYGSLIALIVEYVGSRIIARSKTELSLTEDNTTAFRISYRAGLSTGLFMASFGLLGIGFIFVPFKLHTVVTAIGCFAFGSSTVLIFNRTKFKAIADIYESYVQTIISAIILSTLAVKTSNITSTFNTRTAAIFPLIIVGVGIIASIIGGIFVRGRERSWEGRHVNICVIVSAILMAAASSFLSYKMLQSYVYALAVVIGIILGIAAAICSSRQMTIIPLLLFAITMIVPYFFIGLYGIALAAVGFIAITAVLISINAFGIVSEAGLSILNLGNGYATCASALAVLAVFVAYVDVASLGAVNIIMPKVLAGLLIGVALPLVYVSVYARNTDDRDYTFLLDLAAIFVPIIVGLLLGIETLGALLGGLVTSGLITSFIVNNPNVNNSRNDVYVIVSSINSLIKYMTITSLVFAPVFSQFGAILPN